MSLNRDLFTLQNSAEPRLEQLGPQAMVLYGHALAEEAALLAALQGVTAMAPFRYMTTPNGYQMSVAMTNCGVLGWISDRHGYRYTPQDPSSGLPWPNMPPAFQALAATAAAAAGFDRFEPDACLINCYTSGTRLSLHQDKNERDFSQPIVSVSLGAPAVFLFGGLQRSDKTRRITLVHGDVVVWGGADRLRYHGVLPLKPYSHPVLGNQRINLTLRKAS
jgi:alkylated DNA repair protein (DNA oxidative demethylase)